MDMFEEARTLRGMINMCSLTQSEIAKRMGVSQSYVANKLRLLNFSEAIQEQILGAGLTERHARLLLKLPSDELIDEALKKITAMHLSVAASEALIDTVLLDDKSKSIPKNSTRDSILRFEEVISDSVKRLISCGIKVRYTTDKYAGKRYITLCIDESGD